MRALLSITLLLSSLLSACSTSEIPFNKRIEQSGKLKIHPGLVGPATADASTEAQAKPDAQPATGN